MQKRLEKMQRETLGVKSSSRQQMKLKEHIKLKEYCVWDELWVLPK